MMRSAGFVLAIGALVTAPVAWTAEKKETALTLDQVPAPVKATIQKESAGARVDEIEKETEGGKTFYEAEIVKNGRESYVHVAANGKVLKRESGAQERKAEGAERQGHRY